MTDVAYPDAVYGPGDAEPTPAHPLNPCPNCGAVPHDQPELFGKVGKTAADALEWTKRHCWRCGYIPSSEVESTKQMQVMWTQFQEWYSKRPELHHASVSPDFGGAPAEARRAALSEALQNPPDQGGSQ